MAAGLRAPERGDGAPRARSPKSDLGLFWREIRARPLGVSALAPSSTRLADLITAELGGCRGPVIELGPGTGVFTRAIIRRGVPESRIAMIEASPVFVARLREEFPQAIVIEGSAGDLWRLTPFGDEAAAAVVSGLPLLSMGLRAQWGVLEGVKRRLAPGGAFYQFTYGHRPPVPRLMIERAGLRARRLGGVSRNLPPAAVYKFTRRV